MTSKIETAPDIKTVVKEKYGQAALRVTTGGSSCCGAAAALDGCCDPITSNLYDAEQAGQIPEEAVLASLGCGNPTALAELKRVEAAGETVPRRIPMTESSFTITSSKRGFGGSTGVAGGRSNFVSLFSACGSSGV